MRRSVSGSVSSDDFDINLDDEKGSQNPLNGVREIPLEPPLSSDPTTPVVRSSQPLSVLTVENHDPSSSALTPRSGLSPLADITHCFFQQEPKRKPVVRKNGLTLKDVSRDGSCFFDAVFQQFNKECFPEDIASHHQLREIVVNFLEMSQETFFPDSTIYGEYVAELQNVLVPAFIYCELMRELNCYAEGPVIVATAMLLNVALLIVEDRPFDPANDGKQILINEGEDSLGLIKLCRQQCDGVPQHYQIVTHVELNQEIIKKLPEHLRPSPAFCP